MSICCFDPEKQQIFCLGARTVKQVNEALGALDLHLDGDECERLEQAVPAEQIAGTRYDKVAMTHLDSER